MAVYWELHWQAPRNMTSRRLSYKTNSGCGGVEYKQSSSPTFTMDTNIPAFNVTTKSYQKSSPSLLVADLDDDNNRPRHKRSASSPHSFSFIFQRLTVDTRASSSSHHQQLLLKTSPAKRPLKRLPGALPHKMDQEVSGQTGHDASKEAARRAIQNGK